MKSRVVIDLTKESEGLNTGFSADCEISEQSISFSHDEFKNLMNSIASEIKPEIELAMFWNVIVEL